MFPSSFKLTYLDLNMHLALDLAHLSYKGSRWKSLSMFLLYCFPLSLSPYKANPQANCLHPACLGPNSRKISNVFKILVPSGPQAGNHNSGSNSPSPASSARPVGYTLFYVWNAILSLGSTSLTHAMNTSDWFIENVTFTVSFPCLRTQALQFKGPIYKVLMFKLP